MHDALSPRGKGGAACNSVIVCIDRNRIQAALDYEISSAGKYEVYSKNKGRLPVGECRQQCPLITKCVR